MKFSKKSRYGLRALVDLLVHSHEEYVTLISIAERNEISQQYLEQIFAVLRRNNILKSNKGPQGGYTLNKSASEIKISDIIRILEGDYQFDSEVDEKKGDKLGQSIQTLLIDKLNHEIDTVLQSITLADLEEEYQKQCEQFSDMYYI